MLVYDKIKSLTSSHLLCSRTLDFADCMPWNRFSNGMRGAQLRLLLTRLSNSWQLLFQRLRRSRTEPRMWEREPRCTESSRMRDSAVCWSCTGILLDDSDRDLHSSLKCNNTSNKSRAVSRARVSGIEEKNKRNIGIIVQSRISAYVWILI